MCVTHCCVFFKGGGDKQLCGLRSSRSLKSCCVTVAQLLPLHLAFTRKSNIWSPFKVKTDSSMHAKIWYILSVTADLYDNIYSLSALFFDMKALHGHTSVFMWYKVSLIYKLNLFCRARLVFLINFHHQDHNWYIKICKRTYQTEKLALFP